MATTLATAIARGKRRYGLDDTVDDPLLSNALFIDRCNEILREGIRMSGGREDFTINLPTTNTVTLSTRLISLTDDTLRIDYDGDGTYETEPILESEETLRSTYGVLENEPGSIPRYYYTRRNTTADAGLQLILFPASDTAVTNGIKLNGRTVPVVLTATSDSLPVQVWEEDFLIPGFMVALAEANRHRGRPDGASELVECRAEWERAKIAWADAIEDGLRGSRRRVRVVDQEYDSSY